MARPQSPTEWLRTSRSRPEQIASLQLLKNEITGHIQKKEEYVQKGVLDQIVRLLQTSRSAQDPNGKERRDSTSRPRSLSEQDEIRLQALQLLSVIANGGPPFLRPIHTAGAMPAILANIFPLDNHPKIVLWALRALNSIAESSSLASNAASSLGALANLLFTPLCLDASHSILASESRHRVVQEQKYLAASLIGRLCHVEKHQTALANYGILDDLATMLAAFVVARGEVVPAAAQIGHSDGLDHMIPAPAPPGANLAVVLEAISAIIADSRFRAYLLICSPAMMAVFPNTEFEPATKAKQRVRMTLAEHNLGSLTTPPLGAVDYLLPIVPAVQPKPSTQAAQFPPLGFTPSRDTPSTNGNARSSYKFSFWDTASAATGQSEADEESPLIPWLIHLIRCTSGLEKVNAASVLASLFKAGFADAEREPVIAALVIPILCRFLKYHSALPDDSSDIVGTFRAILERTPAVLARLIAGSELMQKAAYDCKALKSAAQLLVESYNLPAQQTAPRPWSPTPSGSSGLDERSAASRLGEQGHLPVVAHKLRIRESALRLIAAMLPFKDDYRKAFVEQEVIGYVVESLQPCPSKPKTGKERVKPEKAADDTPPPSEPSPYGNNPNSVLIAACHVVRLLGRSISILRTSLEDHGTAMPLFRLLKHPDAEVQVAACGAVCNLVLEYSPVRDQLLEAGIVKTLCEHAHSQDAELRHNAIWSLKHLVNDAPNTLRKQCLDELEPGWLVQLIRDDTEDDALFARMKRDRHVRDDYGDMDMELELGDYEEEAERPWLWPALYRTNSTRSTSQRAHSPRIEKAEARLTALREAELNPVRKARDDDLAIQEQGLGFIRNLLGPPVPRAASAEMASDQTEMVDYVFNELGQDRLFEILTSKLRTKVLHPFERRHSGRDTRVVYPQARTVENVVYILVHIAASVPRHRQLVISQTELLKQVGTHFSSNNSLVRRALCHLFTNLVWKDEQSDTDSCAARATELRRLGFMSKLEALESGDSELDVRERARVAVWEMKQLPQ
ncbi:ARM repeat-containing protein [Coniochaeta ligniaria NRRL 30616]|uniref:ARM repeat-containing protein n=1 Tax=Coniochaeta ligniaria NRRL 30616 TaxID=1408157 RepID=A0A1J7JIV3_9PEZI|nr:ARM repeat-containing protein [Coniochaeta ligniaria NRRL 30616]